LKSIDINGVSLRFETGQIVEMIKILSLSLQLAESLMPQQASEQATHAVNRSINRE
jgi:hypothetical protein